MRGLLDLDYVCLKEIFQFLDPIDLSSMKGCSRQIGDFVDDYCCSLYLAREHCLDLTGQDIRNVEKILKNFGKFVRRLKVGEKETQPNCLLDVIATNCSAVLKDLSLHHLRFYEFEMKKFTGVFDNLEILELFLCAGDPKYIENFLLGHEYSNLMRLIVDFGDGPTTESCTEILQKFFLKKRNIKELACNWISGDLWPLIITNAAEIEELNILVESERNLMSVAQLRKLKELTMNCEFLEPRAITALINELSINNDTELKVIKLAFIQITDEFCDALSKLTNLEKLKLEFGFCLLNDIKSIEMLGRELMKLKSLALVDFVHFPYRDYLASACKSDNFRTLHVWGINGDKSFQQMLKDIIDRRGHRSFVSGNPLYIHLEHEMFDGMKELFTKENLQSIEKYGNINILRAVNYKM